MKRRFRSKKKFGRALRSAMKRGVPATDVARYGGITTSHVYAILAGERLPSPSVAKRIARRFSEESHLIACYVHDYKRKDAETKAFFALLKDRPELLA